MLAKNRTIMLSVQEKYNTIQLADYLLVIKLLKKI